MSDQLASAPPTELVVVDMAGTTVTDDGTVLAAFDQVFRAMESKLDGVDYTTARQFAFETMGQSKIEVFRELLGDEDLASEANTRFEDAYAEQLLRTPAQPIAGARKRICDWRAQGMKVCATTGFSPSTRNLILHQLNWEDLFDLALSPSSEVRGRPCPDLVLAAALRLKVSDMKCVVVVGDTTHDLRTGTSAGAGQVVGVLSGAHSRVALESVAHTAIIDSIDDLDWLRT